ncbi:hypothetical protein GUJ93_ZPchr0011g28068 [Zizania palustris]|uniref:Uncharacterized protein n=1 Tax=Zizania palustris TaxID=103762 RepID=A0A8J6BN15_ZIZPA|nr:hypothetical protein GUJ93_ZPchr0011g28068 [Zizania palustris]
MAMMAKQDTRLLMLAALMVILSCASEIAVRRSSLVQLDGDDGIGCDLQRMPDKNSSAGGEDDSDAHAHLMPTAGQVREHCYDVAGCTLENCRSDCRVTHFDENLAYCQNDNRCCCKYILLPFHEADNPGPGTDLGPDPQQQQQQHAAA